MLGKSKQAFCLSVLIGIAIVALPSTSGAAPAGHGDGGGKGTQDGGGHHKSRGPTVTIDQATGQPDPTTGTPIHYTAVFSTAVTGLNGQEVAITGSAGGTKTATVTDSGDHKKYDIAIAGIATSGTVQASIPAGAATDSSGNPNLPSTSTDNTVTYYQPGPALTINQASSQPDPTTGTPIHYTAVFSTAVTGLNGQEVAITGSAGGTKTATVTDSGDHKKYDIAIAGIATSGTVQASIPAGAATDSSGNPNLPSTSTDNTVTYYQPGPALTINQASSQPDPTTGTPIHYTAVFSTAVTGLNGQEVAITGSAGGTKTATVTDSGDHKKYDIAIAGIATSGTVQASIPAGAATDSSGNPNLPSTSTDKTVTYTLPAPPPPPSGGLIVGMHVNAAGGGTGALDKAVGAGAHWVREDLWWPAVQPSQGTLDWSLYDSLFLSAAQRDIHILPVIDEVPSWTGASSWTIPSDPTLFAAFTGLVAARYGPGGLFWQAHPGLSQYAPVFFEIWNEPWYLHFSSSGIDPARYARLFKAAAGAGHAANPQARFIVGAEWQYQAADSSWRNWVDDMYAAVPDLNNYLDAYSVHPYGNGSVDNWTPHNGDAFETQRLTVIHDLFVSHGAGDKKMWVTEIGWSTCSDGSLSCYTEAQQAQNIARFDQLVRSSWTYVQAVFYYCLSDYGPADPTNREAWYGIVRRDGSHKPAWAAFQTALSQ